VERRAVSKIEILGAEKETRTLQLDPLLLRLAAARAEKVGRLAREQLGFTACDPSEEACYDKVGRH
jgi:hypothetical protein